MRHKNLEDLLKKSGTESLDDFEKEALEGFNSLGSEQEALDLKSQLDERIYTELLQKKKTALRVYWYAAAGLFLMVGISVFFMLKNNVLDNEKVALKQPDQSETVAPADMTKIDEPEEAAKETAVSAPVEEKKPAAPLKTEEKDLRNKLAEADNETSGPKTITSADNIFAGKKQDMDDPISGKNINQDIDKTIAGEYKALEEEKEVSTLKDAKGKDAEGEKAGQIATKQPAEDEIKKEFKSTASETNSKNKRKKAGAKQKASGNSMERSEDNAPGELANTGAGKMNDDKKAVEKTAPSSSAVAENARMDANTDSENAPSFYSGGEQALEKDIREKLDAMRLNKKFDATLYINNKKEVEKVKFTKKYDLNKDDETHITEALKSLNKFNFINTKPGDLFEYEIKYRP